jgi:hypothetical protein
LQQALKNRVFPGLGPVDRAGTQVVTAQGKHNDCGQIGIERKSQASSASLPKKAMEGCRSRGGSFDDISKGEAAVEDMERRNAVQYLLMVYLGAKQWAKMPGEMRTSARRSKGHSYPPQRLEPHPGGVASNAALLERL